MTINTFPQFLLKLLVYAGLVATLAACGGSGDSAESPIQTSSSSQVVTSSSVINSSASSLLKSSVSSSAASLSSAQSSLGSSKSTSSISSSLSSSSSSQAAEQKPYLQGGAIQGVSLNLSGAVSTFAGVKPGADGKGLLARFESPIDVASDGTNLYVADSKNNTIRKVVIATGEVTTLAGAAGVSGKADGKGAAASFQGPTHITIVGADLYVTDLGNSSIRKIAIATGEVTTFVGGSFGSADGLGIAASFTHPGSITNDGQNLYLIDRSVIRKIVIATAAVSTLPLEGEGYFWGEGIVYNEGNLYVADYQRSVIHKIAIATGQKTILAGQGQLPGGRDGVGEEAGFYHPSGITTDGTNLYVSDSSNYLIRKIVLATGAVTTLAGYALFGGDVDGVSSDARFFEPTGIVFVAGNLYVTDAANYKIRKLALATGEVTTLAGARIGKEDGIGAAASFATPTSPTTDGSNLYLTDSDSARIRKIDIASGATTTLMEGSWIITDDPDRLIAPGAITNDGSNLYVIDRFGCIRKIVIATGAISTLAGTNDYGVVDGIGSAARFSGARGITTDGTNLYVTDSDNGAIRKVVIATGEVTTLAVKWLDAMPLGLYSPHQITTDGTNLYVTDFNNPLIYKIVIASSEQTILAGGGSKGTLDGTGKAASFFQPAYLTTDGSSLYVTDAGDNSIRKIVLATGVVTTVIGSNYGGFNSDDGVGVTVGFNSPNGITTDGKSLFVSDSGINTIRKID